MTMFSTNVEYIFVGNVFETFEKRWLRGWIVMFENFDRLGAIRGYEREFSPTFVKYLKIETRF